MIKTQVLEAIKQMPNVERIEIKDEVKLKLIKIVKKNQSVGA